MLLVQTIRLALFLLVGLFPVLLVLLAVFLAVVVLVGLDYHSLVAILATTLFLKIIKKEGRYLVASRLRLPGRNARGFLVLVPPLLIALMDGLSLL
jgi:hypothetical protein